MQRRVLEGPGAVDISVEEGLAAMQRIIQDVNDFKLRATELNSAELLFSLPVTEFATLEDVKRDVDDLDSVYTVYADHEGMVRNWSDQAWAKVDIQVMYCIQSRLKECWFASIRAVPMWNPCNHRMHTIPNWSLPFGPGAAKGDRTLSQEIKVLDKRKRPTRGEFTGKKTFVWIQIFPCSGQSGACEA